MFKNIFLLISILASALYISAQIPQALNYQAIARNLDGTIIPGQSVGVRFSILDGSVNGPVLYQETQQTTTNNFGLFILAIGKGTAVSGTVPSIDWSTGGDKFLKVEIAPQGGTTYTIQGVTQLLSVPYALYAEKTKLIGGNAITINNGNTINANYTAGPGIIINGNTISATAGNSWLLNGNAGTTASNFLGTTDDQRLYFKTNNKVRMFLEKSTLSPGSDLSLLSLSDEAGSATNPAQLSIWGREIVGVSANMLIANNVTGQTWGQAMGNTQGRMIRFSQMTSANFTQSHFYDLGISQDSSFYISDHWLQNGGPNIPRKMITISPQNLVGINLNNSEKPTANFHTKGTLRFEGINTNNALTRIVAMDANGNVASRDASTLGNAGNDWSLLGNSGTTLANFLGTTDNQPLYVRTNNTNRLMIDAGQPVTGGNLSTAFLSDFASIRSAPAQFAVYGKDVNGVAIPVHLFSSVEGMNWGATGGTNNTLGRFLRMTQMTSATYSAGQFFDFGIDQGVSFYLSNRGLNSAGGVLPKKMITVSPQDFVGINFDWGQDPTANFHTKGTLRFEGVNTNNVLTRILAMDANGNVASRDASTLTGGFWVADASGIHNSNTGHVGIGGLSSSLHGLNVEMMDNTADGRATVKFSSNDSWQTNLWMNNTSNSTSFNLVIGGIANTQPNYGVGAGGFGIVNVSNGSTMPLIITSDNKVGIGNSLGGTNNQPKSRLHVQNGDVYIDQIGSGVIMKSPNGQCWRMTVSNAGAPVFTAIPCP